MSSQDSAIIDQNAARLGLDTLPSEVRILIYDLIFRNLFIYVDKFGTVEINYPWSLTAVSSLLRSETLPILKRLPLKVTCESGRFPYELSRRIPDSICQSIKQITLQGSMIEYDIKVAQFPNLELLVISGYVMARAETFHRMAARIRDVESKTAFIIERCARAIMEEVQELHEEQERPREGLERDYFVEGTLFELLNRPRRTFKVQVEATFVWGVLDDLVKTIHFDWDTREGDVNFNPR